MKQQLRIFNAICMFVGIFAGCLALLLLLILMVRFPPILIAVLLTCWIFSRLLSTEEKPSQRAE